ncbi:MAG: TIGR02391 family protein [Bacilli bacterium]
MADELDRAVKDPDLYKVVAKLFRDGHHARAVEEAFKLLNNLVKRRIQSSDDGSKLMKNAFTVNNPELKLNPNVTESERNEQQGYMEILSGCMTGIRNPRAHDHDWEDSEEHALELLTIANHLIMKVRAAERARPKGVQP